MRIQVLYFAAARERAGTSREELEVPEGASVQTAIELIALRHPGLRELLPHLRIAVNLEFGREQDPLPAGAELALIPPVAGGAGLFHVVDRPLDLAEVIAAVSGDEHGGLATFSGSVRGETRGRRVVRLEYEAYGPMAEKVLERIGEEIVQRWPGSRVAIVHRTGTLKPGELAVVIAAAAPHRREAFRACEYAIDRIKADAPIWKKECYEDGEVWVGMRP
ncbi:MAG TPA: molybdenum cofactor biosynthesis protein MoaE [Myxococcaceae bacterium]|nr:molybdenum cofactor biosynthesis protein MoaE [Myxococcaceae bacterium]